MELYPRFYGRSLQAGSRALESKINEPVNHFRSAMIEAFKKPGSVLDIGCGKGFFLEFMRRKGWRVSGLEASSNHVRYARECLRLEGVGNGSWPQGEIQKLHVDVVTMFHVIEHLLSPVESVSAVHDVLKPGGLLVLETPNLGSWPARLFRHRWVTLDAPRHVNVFSEKTLRSCLEKAVFEIVHLRTFSPSTMEYSESLRYTLQDFGLRRYRDNGRKFLGEGRAANERDTAEDYGKPLNGKAMLHFVERKAYAGLNKLAERYGAGCNLFVVAAKRV
jgi:2-polyprenyl-3-methyl-5-hydroxy-6-metoxy-1,4-benzoquinol methylase